MKSSLLKVLLCHFLLSFVSGSYANDAVIYIDSTVDAPSDPGPIIVTFSGLISNNPSDWPYCGYSPDLSGVRVYNFNGPVITGGPVYWLSLGCHCGDGLDYTISGGSADGAWHATGGGHVDYNNGTINVLISGGPPPPLPADDTRHDPNDCSLGMAHYTADLSTTSLNISDKPLQYSPPIGPKIDFVPTYHQRDADQSSAQAYSNLGPNWTFNWMSYVTDDPANPSANAAVYVRGGGTETYTGFDSGTQSYLADPKSQAVLVRTSTTSYERRFPDGSKEVFALASGAAYPRLVFMTQVIDPAGNAATITYLGDGTNRIDTVIDALGQSTHFAYEEPTDIKKVTKVTDPFGRNALLGYTNGQLTSITDPVGILSQFHYTPGSNFIDSLTTPYGTSTFATGENGTNRWLNLTDPTGAVERYEYRDNAPGIGSTEPVVPAIGGIVNINLNLHNTFYWDKKALSMYPPVNGVYDYTRQKSIIGS